MSPNAPERLRAKVERALETPGRRPGISPEVRRLLEQALTALGTFDRERQVNADHRLEFRTVLNFELNELEKERENEKAIVRPTTATAGARKHIETQIAATEAEDEATILAVHGISKSARLEQLQRSLNVMALADWLFDFGGKFLRLLTAQTRAELAKDSFLSVMNIWSPWAMRGDGMRFQPPETLDTGFMTLRAIGPGPDVRASVGDDRAEQARIGDAFSQ